MWRIGQTTPPKSQCFRTIISFPIEMPQTGLILRLYLPLNLQTCKGVRVRRHKNSLPRPSQQEQTLKKASFPRPDSWAVISQAQKALSNGPFRQKAKLQKPYRSRTHTQNVGLLPRPSNSL